jgi:dsDNA-specific endonuclease/ATPase MutS2
VNAIARAKISESIQCFKAIPVVNDTTTHECTDGIHPLPKACHISNLPVFVLIDIPFINTVTKNVITGTNSKLA